MTLCPVILAGGEGNRLWPLSRRHYPKQLIRLFGERSLLQETLLRCAGIATSVRVLRPLIICNEVYRFIVAQQAAEINTRAQPLILEPVGRNTAPALTVAALAQSDRGDDPVLLMLPASVWLEAIKECRAEIYQACARAYQNGQEGNDFFRLAGQAFIDCPGDSVDYAVMVLNKDKSQDIRQLVATLNAGEREELNQHLSVQRPWGEYETIEVGTGYRVKRLVIRPGGRISLQLHHKRSEHWVVVKGTATITREEEVFDLKVNESTFIPLGVRHRLENRTGSVLELIEVQVGGYIGEDDIVRFDDDFKR